MCWLKSYAVALAQAENDNINGMMLFFDTEGSKVLFLMIRITIIY